MIISRNETEFKRLYDKYFECIYKFIFVAVKNSYDCADICQDVFFKLFTIEKEFKDDEHVKAWLLTCSKNSYIDFFRKKDNNNFELDLALDKAEEMQTDETLPVLMNLDEKYKMPLLLHYYEGYKTDEIAKILNIAHATVRIRLKRGRELLKKNLEGLF